MTPTNLLTKNEGLNGNNKPETNTFSGIRRKNGIRPKSGKKLVDLYKEGK